MSLGNISSDIRNKPSHRCWILIAYIPIPIFTDPKSVHTALHHRLFHQCLATVLNSLIVPGQEGIDLVDSRGDVRCCFPRVAAYLADYPEQLLINIAAQWNSPVTTAGFAHLGNSRARPRRTKQWILSRIDRACEQADPNDIAAYTAAAKEFGLNAVNEPFWRHLPGYQPELVLAPDNLHGLFRFWRDHILQWIIKLVGEEELDHRLEVLQPMIGLRHFANGIKHLSQWTGREDRELQRIILASIAGAPKINSEALRCLRAFHDFLYLAQYRSHSPTTLKYLQISLRSFHTLKNIFITNGARCGKNGVISHFCIPKLAGLYQYIYHIPRMGSSIQFSTEVTENCHQVNAKRAYKATNRKDFFKQMCAYLNRLDTISLVEEVSMWYLQSSHNSEDGLPSPTSFSAFVQKMKQTVEKEARLEIRQKQRKSNGYIWRTIRPDRINLSVDLLSQTYNLKDFRDQLLKYIIDNPTPNGVNIATLKLDVWHQCRLQKPSIQDDDELADARTIQAIPPNGQKSRFGRCNCVLVTDGQDLPITGIAGLFFIP